MKYVMDIDIDMPVDKIVELLNNPDNLYKWMEGLVSLEHLEGTPGKAGAKSKLKFKMGNREIEMIETIQISNLPEELNAEYQADGTQNRVIVSLESLPGNKTRYITEQEFKFSNPFMKIMGFLMPGAFKKQSQKNLVAFKKFAEEHE